MDEAEENSYVSIKEQSEKIFGKERKKERKGRERKGNKIEHFLG